jgi:glycerophosphoryl diester phosphodiesterase
MGVERYEFDVKDEPETRNLEPETIPPRPLIVAHRGSSAIAPENTIAAFHRALADGADGVEFDVRLARDGVPVVIHDSNLTRTAGVNENVADLTSSQLAAVDLGSWFNFTHPRHARPEFASEGIASLSSVLQTLENVAGPIFIELKCDVEDEVSPLVDAVCREVKGSALLEKIILKSFRLGVIPQARAVLPGVRTAALFAPQVMRLLRKEKYMIKIAEELGADHLSVHRSLASSKLVKKAAKRGMPVTVWTVNTPGWIGRATKRGVYAVITDDPSKLVARRESILRRRA